MIPRWCFLEVFACLLISGCTTSFSPKENDGAFDTNLGEETETSRDDTEVPIDTLVDKTVGPGTDTETEPEAADCIYECTSKVVCTKSLNGVVHESLSCKDAHQVCCELPGEPALDTGTGTFTGVDTGTDADTGTVPADTGIDTGPNDDSDSDTVCRDGTTEKGDAGITWVTVCGGTFEMGSNERSNEQPIHSVTVPTFEILKSEVTVSQYGACVTAGPCTKPGSGGTWDNWGVAGRENNPLNQVSWYQAVAFCNWVGGRLPTEAEWQYAASNGGAENIYPWGNDTATCTYAVIEENNVDGCGTEHTWDVCSKTAGNTSHGLCDMAGNLWEWVQDWYHPNYNGAPRDGSAWEDPTDDGRTLCGGGFVNEASNVRAAIRMYRAPSHQSNGLGFRCAR